LLFNKLNCDKGDSKILSERTSKFPSPAILRAHARIPVSFSSNPLSREEDPAGKGSCFPCPLRVILAFQLPDRGEASVSFLPFRPENDDRIEGSASLAQFAAIVATLVVIAGLKVRGRINLVGKQSVCN